MPRNNVVPQEAPEESIYKHVNPAYRTVRGVIELRSREGMTDDVITEALKGQSYSDQEVKNIFESASQPSQDVQPLLQKREPKIKPNATAEESWRAIQQVENALPNYDPLATKSQLDDFRMKMMEDRGFTTYKYSGVDEKGEIAGDNGRSPLEGGKGFKDPGDIVVINEKGEESVLNEGFLESLVNTTSEYPWEMLKGVGYGMTGFALGFVSPVPGGGPAVGASTAMVGAMEGRKDNLTIAAEKLNTKLEDAQVQNEMVWAGIEDIAYGVAGAGVAKVAKYPVTAMYSLAKKPIRIFKDLTRGLISGTVNEQGVRQFVEDNIPGLTQKQINEYVTDLVKWQAETKPKTKLGLSFDPSIAELEVRAVFNKLNPELIADAKLLSNSGGKQIKEEIIARQRSITQLTSDLDNNMLLPDLVDELNLYEQGVKDNFKSVVKQGEASLVDPNVRWNLDKLIDRKALEEVAESLEGTMVYGRIKTILNKVNQIGREASAKAMDKSAKKEMKLAKANNEENWQEYATMPLKAEDFNPSRTFSDLLSLRRVLNQASRDSKLDSSSGYTFQKSISKMRDNVDKEIKHIAKTNMEDGDVWLKNFASANDDYKVMSETKANTLYESIMKAGESGGNLHINNVIGDLSESIGDATVYKQVMNKLPPKMRVQADNAIIADQVKKATVSITDLKSQNEAFKAVDFVKLSNELNKYPVTTTEARANKRLIDDMANIYAQDPDIAYALHNGFVRGTESTIATTVVGKLKMTVLGWSVNHFKSAFNTPHGKTEATKKMLAKILDDPMDAKTTQQLKSAMGDDPEFDTLLGELRIAKFQENDSVKQVAWGASTDGLPSIETTDNGKGFLLYLNEMEAKKAIKGTGKKLYKKEFDPRSIFNAQDAERELGIANFTDEGFKNPRVQQRLKEKVVKGVATKDLYSRLLIYADEFIGD